MVATVAGIHLGIDTHANRPAGNAVPDGSLYSCSDHGLVYKSNFAGNSWATWATLGGAAASGVSITDAGAYFTGTDVEAALQELGAASGGGGSVTTTTNPDLWIDTAGTEVDLTATPDLGTGVTSAASSPSATIITYANNSTQYCTKASAISTGDFDARLRVMHFGLVTLTGTAVTSMNLSVRDTARTAGTELGVRVNGTYSNTATNYAISLVGGAETGSAWRPIKYPIMLRVRRVGTTITYFASETDGRNWVTLGSGTSALDIAHIGVYATPGAAIITEAVIDFLRVV